jgi:hypothetical protein
MDTKTINLTQNEIKQLLFGLNARRKRIENRKRNDLKHGKNEFVEIHDERLIQNQLLSEKLEKECITI